MPPQLNQSPLSRRDFLRLAFITASAAALGGCGQKVLPAITIVPTVNLVRPTTAPSLAAATQTTGTALPTSSLLSGLEGLSFDTFCELSYRRLGMREPEALTELGLSAAFGIGDDQLNNLSDAFIRETYSLVAGILGLLRKYDLAALTADQQVTAAVYDWYLDDIGRNQPYMYYDYPINQVIISIHLGLYQLLTETHPLKTRKNAQDYVTRLLQVQTKFAQLVEGLKRRKEQGVIVPKMLIPDFLTDLRSIANGSPQRNPFYEYFSTGLNKISELPAADRQALLSQAEQAINKSVIPAYKELASFFEGVQNNAPEKIGVYQFNKGPDYYAYCLRHHTTTDLSTDQIHDLGKQHVERIQAEMRNLFGKLGYPTNQSIPNLYSRLINETGIYQGQQAVTAYENTIRNAEKIYEKAFDIFPKAQVIVIGGPAGDYYLAPALDGSRPGAFYALTSGGQTKFGVATLAYHETVPGHHFQISVAQELNQPFLRKNIGFTAYVEGWALYAERLMADLGAYEKDLPGDLGRLQAEAFRAARLVVDTGIHAKQWDYDKTVSFLMDATGFPRANTEREIRRYMAWPGQATSYYMGFLKILEARQKAQERMGSKFDLKKFHRVVLGSGALPLDVLAKLVAVL